MCPLHPEFLSYPHPHAGDNPMHIIYFPEESNLNGQGGKQIQNLDKNQ